MSLAPPLLLLKIRELVRLLELLVAAVAAAAAEISMESVAAAIPLDDDGDGCRICIVALIAGRPLSLSLTHTLSLFRFLSLSLTK